MVINFQVKSGAMFITSHTSLISPNVLLAIEITGSASVSVQPVPPVMPEEDEQSTLPDIHKKGLEDRSSCYICTCSSI